MSQRYRSLDDSDVPPELDRAVLSQAHAAVSATKRSRMLRWSAPLALAASVVVVVTLVMLPEVQQEVSKSALPASAPMEYRVPEPDTKQSAADEESLGTIAPPQMKAAPELSIRVDNAADAPKTEALQSQVERVAREQVASASKRMASQREQAAAAPPAVKLEVPPPPPTVIRQMTSVAPAPVAQPHSARSRVESAGSAASSDSVSQVAGNGANGRSAEVAQSAATADRAQQTPAQRVGPRETVPMDERVLSRTEAEMKQRREDDAPQWLEYIRELRRDGRAGDADQQWRAFIARHPEFVVDARDQARPPE